MITDTLSPAAKTVYEFMLYEIKINFNNEACLITFDILIPPEKSGIPVETWKVGCQDLLLQKFAEERTIPGRIGLFQSKI